MGQVPTRQFAGYGDTEDDAVMHLHNALFFEYGVQVCKNFTHSAFGKQYHIHTTAGNFSVSTTFHKSRRIWKAYVQIN
jgi:hypothetical protein